MAGVAWQKALFQLQANSWNIGRVPTARHWLDFFHSHASPLSAPVRLLIANSIRDAVRLARLQQLLLPPSLPSLSPVAVLSNSQCGGDGEQRIDSGAPNDVTGVFLSTANQHSEFLEVLSHWCAAHETPKDGKQLMQWLHETATFLRFFTLPSAFGAISLERKLYIICEESLQVLHHAICAVFLRQKTTTEANELSGDVTVHKEAALLAMWLLVNSRRSGYIDNNNDADRKALQETQMLLASRKETQAWLLHLPSVLRDRSESAHCGNEAGKANAEFIFEMQERSSVCKLAREILFPDPSILSPNVGMMFVDELHVKGEAAVYAMHEQLSDIASGNVVK